MNIEKNFSIPFPVDLAIRRIMDSGGQAYIVGGAVRDIILDRTVNDWDIATSLKPEQVEALFPDMHTIPTGKKFGTITVIIDNMPIEVTTFRGEDEYTDYRHPDNIVFVPDIKLDLARRDFTINAIAYNPYREPAIIDPMDGLADIKNKLIRAVGIASCRFAEDPLRMMRGARFLSQLGFDMESETYNAIKSQAPLLLKVSSERIRDELNKLLMGPFAFKGLSFMLDAGLLNQIFSSPEIKSTAIDIPSQLKAIDSCPHDLNLRLAAIFNFSIIPYHIKNQELIIRIIRQILNKLRYDKQTISHVSNVVLGVRSIWFSQQISQLTYQLKKMVSLIGKDDAFRAIYIKEIAQSEMGAINNISDILKEILNRGDPIYISDLAINGNDLLKLGIGKDNPSVIGKLLALAQEWVLKSPQRNDAKYLLPRLQSIIPDIKYSNI